MPLQTIAVIGAGPAGRAFALRCAAAGLDVILEDVMPSNLRRAQDDFSTLAPTAGSIRYAATVEDAVREADIAIDFVPDELESKLEIFSLLDRMAPPRTLLCTPTRALSITDLASCTYRPTLCLALRNSTSSATQNALESPLEIIHTPTTDPNALTAVTALLTRLGIISQVAPDLEEPMLVKNAKKRLKSN